MAGARLLRTGLAIPRPPPHICRMPELPEVETVVRGLRPILEGRRILRVTPRRAGLRRPFPTDLAPRLEGARVTGLARRAKYGLVATDRADTLVFHLGMSGHFHILAGPPEKHDHLLFRLAATPERPEETLALADPRRFGLVLVARTDDLPRLPLLAALGPEPLSPAFTGAALARIAAGHATPIKSLLMDSRRVAGLGNIYALEALFEAGIHPARPAASLTAAECARLARAIRAVLRRAITAGGSTLRDHRQPDGRAGYFQHQFDVYDRAGTPCHRCGTPIVRIRQGGRSSFFCPTCQPERPAESARPHPAGA